MLKRIAAWWKRKLEERRASVMFEREVVVSFDEFGVSSAFPTGETQSIAWRDVERVAIETNDSGPWGADVWWLLESAESSVSYPQGATGDPQMLEQYPARFAGFNDGEVIRAMGCTSNARFVCWERGKN
jgi:hypothetical protein